MGKKKMFLKIQSYFLVAVMVLSMLAPLEVLAQENITQELLDELCEVLYEDTTEELSEEFSEEISEENSGEVPEETSEAEDVEAGGDIIAEGQYEDVTWKIDSNGKLTVEGTGNFKDYYGDAPWKSYQNKIMSAEINLTRTTDASHMFSGCSSLTSLDLRNFDTSNATSMDRMFSGCSSLTSLDVSSFNTSNVRSMEAMFLRCESLTSVDVSTFDTSNVTNMKNMFSGNTKLTTLNVSSFDTSNVVYMSEMFEGCSGLKELDLSNFNLNNTTQAEGFFSGTKITKIDSPTYVYIDISLDGEFVHEDTGDAVSNIPQGLTKSISLKTQDASLNNPKVQNGISKWDCVWFGQYWQTDTNGDGKADSNDNKEPLKWRVLEVENDTAILISDQIITYRSWNSYSANTTWDTSNVRRWLNSYSDDNGTAADSGFFYDAFCENEKNEIVTIKDAVTLLEVEDATNSNYGFINNESRMAVHTDYAAYLKSQTSRWQDLINKWWLNSRIGKYDCRYIQETGEIYNSGGYGVDHIFGIRPVICIDISKGQHKYAGTVTSTTESIVPKMELNSINVRMNNDITYHNYVYSIASQERQIRFVCKAVDNETTNRNDEYGIEINKIKLTLPDNTMNFGEEGFINKRKIREVELEVNQKILIGNAYSYNYIVHVDEDYEPEAKSKVEIDMNVLVSTNQGDYTFTAKIPISNLDYQRQRAEEKKAEREATNNITGAKSELQKLCNKNNLLLGPALSNFLDEKQIDQIEAYLNCWIASVNNSQTFTDDKEVNRKIMEKLGINPNVGFLWTKTEAVTTVRVNTVEYGEKNIEFTLDCGSLNSNGSLYASFGEISYEILETDNIPRQLTIKGYLGITTYVGMDNFMNCMQGVAEDSIKDAYEEVWGKNANIVAGILVDETIMKILDKKDGIFSDGVYILATKPTKNYIKRVKIECPVDVYIYDMNGEVVGKIVNDVIDSTSSEITMEVIGETKYAYLVGDDYKIRLVGNDVGSMTYTIEEMDEELKVLRTTKFIDLPLEKDSTYQGYVFESLYIDDSMYSLTKQDEIILPDEDSFESVIQERVYVSGVEINVKNKHLELGETYKLFSCVIPENATNQKILWDSSDENIVTISQEGELYAEGEGIALISVITDDGNFKKECLITVGDAEQDDVPKEKPIPIGIWIKGIKDETYTGSAVKQSFRVYDGNKLLKEKTDYTVAYKNNKAAYTYSETDSAFNAKKAPQIVIKMKGNYSGSKTIYFKIQQAEISKENIESEKLTITYSGKKQTPVPTVTVNGKKLKYGNDFTIPEYDAAKKEKTAFTESNTYPITVVGKGNYMGEVSLTLTISEGAEQIAMNKVTVKGVKNLPWTGAQVTQEGYAVSYKKDVLDQNSGEFTVSYGENLAVGNGTMTLTGTGEDKDGDGLSYIGSKTISFKISGVTMSKVTVSGVEKQYVYTGAEIKPVATLKYKANKTSEEITLQEEVHYTVSYRKNIAKGTATVTFTGLAEGGFTGVKKATFKIGTVNISDVTDGTVVTEQVKVSFVDNDRVVNGVYVAPIMKGGVKPEIIVKEGETVLKEGTDYTVSYGNNKAIALSTDKKAPVITIKGKGNYTGSKKVYFTITGKPLTNENGILISAKDKVANGIANGYVQSFKVYDADGKALTTKDYDAKTITYTLIQKVDENGIIVETDEALNKTSVVEAGSMIQISVTGIGAYAGGTASGIYRIINKACDISKATIRIAPQEYTGEAVEITRQDQFVPNKVFIKTAEGNKELVLGRDIEVVEGSYMKNVNKGTAKVTFRGIGEYGGIKTVSYKIGSRSIMDVWAGIYSRMAELFG